MRARDGTARTAGHRDRSGFCRLRRSLAKGPIFSSSLVSDPATHQNRQRRILDLSADKESRDSISNQSIFFAASRLCVTLSSPKLNIPTWSRNRSGQKTGADGAVIKKKKTIG